MASNRSGRPIRGCGEVFRDLADCVLRWKEPRMTSRLAVAVNRLLVELLDVLAEQQLEESPELVTRRRTVELFLKDLAENPASSAEPWTLEAMAETMRHGHHRHGEVLPGTGEHRPHGLSESLPARTCRAKRCGTNPETSVTEIAMGRATIPASISPHVPQTLSDDAGGVSRALRAGWRVPAG